LIKSIALLKRNALAAPFDLAFRQQKELEASGGALGDLMQIHYRDEEAIYIRASPDRVTVIFSTVFREETDRIFGKVFLQVSWSRWLQRQSFRDVATRNSLMLDVSPVSRTLPKYSILIVIRRSKFEMYPVCAILKTLDMSHLCSFPATFPSLMYHTTRSRTFSCSATTFTTTSNVARPTCTPACVTVRRSFRRSSTVPRRR
jgi:hypothetical protein